MLDLSKMTISEIKEKVTALRDYSEELLDLLAGDPRSGVQTIYRFCQNRMQAVEKERLRLHQLTRYETRLWEQGCKLVAGVDEAGRGPLAGPVVAAAVVLEKDVLFEGLNDSKKLTPAQRAELERQIRIRALCFAIGIVSESEIDEINIYQASLLAMQKAVVNLKVIPDFLLVDAVNVPRITVPQKAIIHGDALSHSIAAASILAKEARDRIMLQYDEIFPAYGFAQHKGYGTPQHLEALKKYGPCPIHRKTFGQVRQNNT